MLLLPGEGGARTLTSGEPSRLETSHVKPSIDTCSYRYIDRGVERTAQFPVNPANDVSGVVASASSGPLRDYQDKLKVIQLREKGVAKADIAKKVGRSEHWVKRWWREHPATLERPAAVNDIVLKKASMHSFRDLDIRRGFLDDASLYDTLVEQVSWRQAKVVGRDQNTGELALRYDERGQSIKAGRRVADYSGGLVSLDRVLQKAFSELNIRDPQARVFMNYYADGQEKTGVHRHDFWTCLLSVGCPRILTVDNRPILLRDGDLIVFGTQNHGVPVMPEVTGGRISLVIFFYPDADNLERQWQTVTEDSDDDRAAVTKGATVNVGLDRSFDASLLWGHSSTEIENTMSCGIDECNKEHAKVLSQALTGAKRSQFRSPNSLSCFEGDQVCQSSTTLRVFSISCGLEGPSECESERTLLNFFNSLLAENVAMLWDFRLRSSRQASWSEPDALRRACAARAIKYRHYPLGRPEAGGHEGHVHSEEGQDILRRFVAAARQVQSAFVVTELDWRKPGLRAEISEFLLYSERAGAIQILHIVDDHVEEHHRLSGGASSSPACDKNVPITRGHEPEAAFQNRGNRAGGADQVDSKVDVVSPPAVPQRVNRWGRARRGPADSS